MPEKAKRVFNEAQSLMQLSPRSCCALLRLCVEEIVNYVGAEQGLKNFDPDWILARRIEALAIPEALTQQLTACRVIGNDAAHPGVLDFSERTAVKSLCFCRTLSIIFAPVLSDLLISRNWPTKLRLRGKLAKTKVEVIFLSLFWFLPYKAGRQVPLACRRSCS